MAYINPLLTVIAIAPLPILAVFTRFLTGLVHQRFKKVQEQFSGLTEFARSTISSIRLIQAYNQESSQARRFNAMGEAYVHSNIRLAIVHGTLTPVSAVVGNLSLLLVILYGGRMTIAGNITTGDFVAFISYLYMMAWPMMAIGWVANLFQRGMTSLERIQSMLAEVPSLKDVPAPASPVPMSGARHGIFPSPIPTRIRLSTNQPDIRPCGGIVKNRPAKPPLPSHPTLSSAGWDHFLYQPMSTPFRWLKCVGHCPFPRKYWSFPTPSPLISPWGSRRPARRRLKRLPEQQRSTRKSSP
jgi:ABC-type multidrug transport system fused ATPase/permease subunit